MDYTGERAVPWNSSVGYVMDRHVQRYAWALQFCHGKRVVDLGCGTGYGSFMLSWVAERVIGVDVDEESILFARAYFQADNLVYCAGDVEGHRPQGDIYVAFEVLEHLADPPALARCLDGQLIWSVPIYNESRYHRYVYSPIRAEIDFGGAIYWQDAAGCIVPKAKALSRPTNVLGIR